MPKSFNSVVNQTLHYLSRPHTRILTEPLENMAAWNNESMQHHTEKWQCILSSAEIDELDKAIAFARATRKFDEELTREDFPLPTLKVKIKKWQNQLSDGIGFLVIKGIPVKQWGVEKSSTFFWCLGQHLGVPGAQNKEGQLLGHVKDTGERTKGQEHVRAYKTTEYISYHCDGADVVGLLCMNKAKEGGKSILVSSVTVYNELLKRRPDLIKQLYEPLYLDLHSEGKGAKAMKIEPCAFDGTKLRTFYHSDYFRSVRLYEGIPPLSEKEEELLNVYDTIAKDPKMFITMHFEPGDIQLISNHTVLHSRTNFVDYEAIEGRRHLLRLWLSLEEKEDLKTRALRYAGKIKLLTRFVGANIKSRITA